jgi:hypothetical protein
MPSSARRIAANRANAQKSTGPKSLAGKARAALNAFRHGLATKRILVHGEEAAEFEQTRASMLDHYQPIGPEQTDLFDDMFSAFWRMHRAQYLEQAIFALVMESQEHWSKGWDAIARLQRGSDDEKREIAEELEVDLDEGLNRAAQAFKGQSDVFQTLSQYEARLSRQYLRFRKELRTLQEKDQVGQLGQLGQVGPMGQVGNPQPVGPTGQAPQAPAPPHSPEAKPKAALAPSTSNPNKPNNIQVIGFVPPTTPTDLPNAAPKKKNGLPKRLGRRR